MNKTLLRKWVEALRGGRYKQTRGRLCTVRLSETGRKSYRYCCLGVLARVVGDVPISSKCKASGEHILNREYLIDIGLPNLPQRRLAYLNDTEKWNFKMIASWIQSNLIKQTKERTV